MINISMIRVLLLTLVCTCLSASAVVEQVEERVTIQLDIPYWESPPFRLWNISYPVSDKELHCLALNVYFEARGEHPDGQFAVADVVMWRVNHSEYPDTICGVVQEGVYPSWNPTVPLKNKCQFSWFCDRKPDVPLDIDAFEAAMYVADTVLNDPNYIPVVHYALFYHADEVSPDWAEERLAVAVIGNHLFY